MYKQVSLAICKHNIWFQDTSVKNYFNSKGFNQLTNIEPISISNDPLLFLLALVDTIDPIKIFDCVSDKKLILENILLNFKTDISTFEITVRKPSILNVEKLLEKKHSLNWIKTDVRKIENGLSIKIIK